MNSMIIVRNGCVLGGIRMNFIIKLWIVCVCFCVIDDW